MNKIIKQIVESKFNFNIDIEDNERLNSLSKSKFNSISQKQLYLDLLYIVDLDLPSGTKWCKYNLGVNINKLNKPADWYGDYYAWGEIKNKLKQGKHYNWKTYKFNISSNDEVEYLNKYCTGGIDEYGCPDNLTLLKLEDDVAYLNLHIGNLKFRIPSKELFEELLEYTNNEYIKNYNNINGLNGRIFKSKTNNNEMFIPAAGYCFGDVLSSAGSVANLWSSSLYTDCPNRAWYFFFFGSGWIEMRNYNRCFGMSIHPVLYTN